MTNLTRPLGIKFPAFPQGFQWAEILNMLMKLPSAELLRGAGLTIID
jgi:hypothetical protein